MGSDIGSDSDWSEFDIGSDLVEQQIPTDPFSIFADGYESQNESQDGSQDGNSDSDSDGDFDNNENILARRSEELQGIFMLMDAEELEFDFQPQQNTNHLTPPFTGSGPAPNHDLPDTAVPLDYFSLFYTDEFLQQVC